MMSQTVRDPSKDCFHGHFGRLTRECRARATRRAYKHPIGHIHLVQRISTLGIEGREDRWSGDLGHGTTNERRRHLTAIRELAMCYVIRASPTLGNPSLNQPPVWQMFDNMTHSRADPVSTCCNGPRLWWSRAVRQSLPAFECAYARGRKHSDAGDSGRWALSGTDMARPCIIAQIDHAKTVGGI